MGTAAQAPGRAPTEVIGACGAIVIASVVATAMHVLSPKNAGRPLVFDASVIAVITTLIVWGLLRRQNWLRWLLLIVYAFGSVVVIVATLLKGLVFQPLLYLHAALQCMTFVLLVVPDSHAWFGDDDVGASA